MARRVLRGELLRTQFYGKGGQVARGTRCHVWGGRPLVGVPPYFFANVLKIRDVSFGIQVVWNEKHERLFLTESRAPGSDRFSPKRVLRPHTRVADRGAGWEDGNGWRHGFNGTSIWMR